MWGPFCESAAEKNKRLKDIAVGLAEAADHKNIICPAIYKHFKDKFYATMFISNPKDVPIYGQENYIRAYHTEENRQIGIYKLNGEWYHTSINSRVPLVIYKSLYDDEMPYARPLDMFASEVDKEKYPNIEQKFRFKLIRY